MSEHLERLRDPVQALDLAGWIWNNAPLRDFSQQQDPVLAPYAALLVEAWKVAPAGAEDVRAQLLGPLAPRLAEVVSRAAEIPDPEYGSLFDRAAAHVPIPVQMTRHKTQILPAACCPRPRSPTSNTKPWSYPSPTRAGTWGPSAIRT